jgi:hypothetical protein
MGWELILKTLLEYSVLGVIAFIYLREKTQKEAKLIETQTEKELKQQENFQQLLSSVLNSNKESMTDLKLSIKELGETIQSTIKKYDQNLNSFNEQICTIKENCSINCGQVFTAIYEERGVPKSICYELSYQYLRSSTLDCLLDMKTVIDDNGFETDENITTLTNSLFKMFETRHNEFETRVSSIVVHNLNISNVTSKINIIYKETEQKLKELLNTVTLDKLKSDKNYRKFKTDLKNIVLKYLEDSIKILNTILR